MRRSIQHYPINYLYHLTSVDNMASIYRHGLMSHNSAHGHGYVQRDIADQNVIARRREKEIFGQELHDFVPLYFTYRNPMLFRRRNIQDDVVIICVHNSLLFHPGAIFSDGNAASNRTRFFDDLNDLSAIDWECIGAERWTDFDDGRRKRCAEALIPHQVKTGFFRRLIVRTERARQAVDASFPRGRGAEVQLDWYFDD